MTNAVAAGWALSYVNRVDGRMHLSIHLPHYESELDRDDARIMVTDGTSVVVFPATIVEREARLCAEGVVPADTYRNGLWQVSISAPKGAPFQDAGARICLADPNPISLLVIPESRPRDPYLPRAARVLSTRKQVAKSLGRVADQALIELPPEQAARVRATLRRLARRTVRRIFSS